MPLTHFIFPEENVGALTSFSKEKSNQLLQVLVCFWYSVRYATWPIHLKSYKRSTQWFTVCFGVLVFVGVFFFYFCTQVHLQRKFFYTIISILIFQILSFKVEKDTASITCNTATFKHCLGKKQANNSCHRVGRRWFVGSVKFAHLNYSICRRDCEQFVSTDKHNNKTSNILAMISQADPFP